MFKDRLLRPASVTVSTDIIGEKKIEIQQDKNAESAENEKIVEIEPDSINNSEDNVFDLTDEELE